MLPPFVPIPLLLPCPLPLPCPLTAARIASLRATVALLLLLLLKSHLLRVKMSLFGSLLGLLLTFTFLAASAVAVAGAGLGGAGLAAATLWGVQQRRRSAV
ncbi:MAG: hypothetical protein ACKOXO_00865 [Cyanobium sp.]